MRVGPPGQVERRMADKENAPAAMVRLTCCETREEKSVASWVCSRENRIQKWGNHCTFSAQRVPLCSSMLRTTGM